MDTNQEFQDLQKTIREAGTLALAYFNSPDTDCAQKADGSVVTEIDTAIEHKLVDFIKTNFPGDAIVGEEHGEHEGDSGFVWHIDPIDGTDNFLRKIPFCAISVARLGDTPDGSLGIVYNPITGQMFASYTDQTGISENGHLHHMTPDPLGGRYVMSLGRGKEKWMKPVGYKMVETFGLAHGKGTTLACAALELAYVAANRLDAFITFGLKTYDYAAGLFLVKAAGGAISVYENGEWQLWTRSLKELCSEHGRTIFVSHPDVHQEFLLTLKNPEAYL